jgi:hypothetical protein
MCQTPHSAAESAIAPREPSCNRGPRTCPLPDARQDVGRQAEAANSDLRDPIAAASLGVVRRAIGEVDQFLRNHVARRHDGGDADADTDAAEIGLCM